MKRAYALASLALVVALAAGSSGCIIVDSDSTLTISNRSDYVIVDIAVARVGDPDFGPNLLRGDVLFPGEDITVVLDCDRYDVYVEDEDGFECILSNLNLCFNDAIWRIDNLTLDFCI
jgi:hypothetical protein